MSLILSNPTELARLCQNSNYQTRWHHWLPAASKSSMVGTNVQQKDSLSLRSKEVPSGFHFKSVAANWGSGIFTQQAPAGVHMYKLELPVQSARRVCIGSHAAARIGSFCKRTAANSRWATSQIQRAFAMLSFRVRIKQLSGLQESKPDYVKIQYNIEVSEEAP